jgi:hypothetical protein
MQALETFGMGRGLVIPIDKIIASAMVKLDAVTRAQAVANAIRAGEVEL